MGKRSTRDEFLSALDNQVGFDLLFDHLPGVLFFAKDTEGRLFAANRQLLDLYGYHDPEKFWGVTDFELLPRSLAEKFRKDDLVVVESGEPMLRIIEVFVNRNGLPGWFLTNKLPVRSKEGEVIGVMGTIQQYESHSEVLPANLDIAPALDYLGAHFTENLSISDLAEKAEMPIRQLERRFQKHLQTSPKRFLMRMRVLASCDALVRTRQPIGEIATEVGFYDQATYTRQFKRHMGMTPLQYRKEYD